MKLLLRALPVVLTAGVISLAATAPANASTATYDGATLTWTATPGITNSLSVTWYDGTLPPVSFGDDNDAESADSCDPWYEPSPPTCPQMTYDRKITFVAHLGDGNDRADAGEKYSYVGYGRNTVFYGEDGDDDLSTGTSTDALYGGPGNDTLTPDEDVFENASDVVSGGDGVDTVIVHSYASTGMSISLDGVANDGELAADGVTSEEQDNYLPDVENITGASDTSNAITGSSAANAIVTGDYSDTIDPLGGADTVTSGGGDDIINLADGVADTLDCGAGSDAVTADPRDVLTGCENVTLVGGPTGSDASPAAAKVTSKKLAASSAGKIKVALSCPAGSSGCTGKLSIGTAKKYGPGKKAARVAVGRRSIQLSAAETTAVSVKLTKSARTLVRKNRSILVKVRITPTGAGLKAQTTELRLTRK